MTPNRLKKLSWISILMIVFLLGATLLPDDAGAYTAEKTRQEQLDRKQETLQLPMENYKTSLKEGNSYILEPYLEPIHFKVKGLWEEVDNGIETLSSTKALDTELIYQNEANRDRLGFASYSGGEEASLFSIGFHFHGSGFDGRGEGEGGDKGPPDRLQRGPP